MLNQIGIGASPARATGRSPRGFGGWRIDPPRHRLVRGDDEVRLEPKVMRTLLVLLEHAGRPIERGALIRAVWGHAHVTDDALNRCVAQLRRAFRGMADGPTIETLPRVGYQLHLPAATPPARRGRLAAAAVLSLGLLFLATLAAWLMPAADRRPPSVTAPARPLTTMPGQEMDAALSPDGRAVAFAHRPAGGSWQLQVLGQANGEPLALTDGARDAVSPAWSPDGSSIAFLSFTPDACFVERIDAGGANRAVLTACHPRSDHSLVWLDARSLVFSPPGDGPKRLARIDLDSGAITPLTEPPDGAIGDAEPAVGRDGELVFTRWQDYGVADLFLLASDGSERRLTFDHLKVHGAAWIGEGALLFSSNRGGSFDLWSLDLDRAEPVRMALGAGDVDGPAFDPRTERLIFEQWQGRADIVGLSLGDGTRRTVISSSRWDWSARPAPDGRTIAFVSDRSGVPEVWLSDPDGGDARQLTDHGGSYVNDIAWVPDGSAVIHAAPVGGAFDLYRVANEGEPVRLTTHPASDRYPFVDPATGDIYYGSQRDGAWGIYRLAAGSDAAPDRIADGSVPRLDRDRRWLYAADCVTGALVRTSLANGVREPVLSLAPIDCGSWTLVGDQLVAIVRTPAWEPELTVIDLVGGERRTVAAVPAFRHGSALAVHRGEVWLTETKSVESDLMVATIGR